MLNFVLRSKVEGQGVNLTFDTHVAYFFIKLIANTKLKFTDNNSSQKK